MDMLTLQYWIYGQDIYSIFHVKIPGSDTLVEFQEAIKSKNPVYEHSTLMLYPTPLPENDDHYEERLEKLLRQWTPQGERRLIDLRLRRLSDLDLSGNLIIVDTVDTVRPFDGVPSMTFNCWIRGQHAKHIFQVRIRSTDAVAALKEAIKDKKPMSFQVGHIDPDVLDLYKVSFPVDNIGERLKDFNLDHGELISPVGMVSDIPAELGRLHIVVDIDYKCDEHTTHQEGLEKDDVLTELINSFQRTTSIPSRNLTPSQEAKSKEYMRTQSTDLKIFDCRCPADAKNQVNTVAPPIQLFNPAFTYFSSKAFDPKYSVPPYFICDIRELVTQFTQIHVSENARQLHLKSFLERAIHHPLSSVQNCDSTMPDFQALSSSGKLSVYLVVGEEKNEIGDGGSDPSVQAALSFLRIFRQMENTELRLRCCCPAFLIGHAGPWLTIMGGIITSNCVVQRLTDFLWIPVHSSLDDDQFLHIARVLYALRESVEQLDSWYKTVEDIPPCSLKPIPHPRFFPSPNTYQDKNGMLVRFVYQKPLERSISCVTYRAKTLENETQDIVVKFVTSYSEDVHRHMASAGFAPKLFYYGPINVTEDMPSYGALRMVVMEYVEGLTFDEALKQGNIPQKFKVDLHQAFKHLHSAGYVFGDLRPPNVIIAPDRDSTAQLIDFDWAGKEGKVKYPVSISMSINWPGGVQALEDIRKEHDLKMLTFLTQRL